MPDERQELGRINWSECFPFTQLFRSFRLAVHPAKLGLALAAVLVLYGAGRLMDGIWGTRVVVDAAATEMVPATEVEAFMKLPPDAFRQWRRDAEERRVAADARLVMQTISDLSGKADRARELAADGRVYGRIEDELDRKLKDAAEVLTNRLQSSLEIVAKRIEAMTGQQKRREQEALPARRLDLKQAHDALLIMLTKGRQNVPEHLSVNGALDRLLVANRGLTEAKAKQEDAKRLSEDRDTLGEALRLRAAMDEAGSRRGGRIFDTMMNHGIVSFGLGVRSVLAGKFWVDDRPDELPGLVGSIKRALLGGVWFFKVHWLFAIIYLAIWLVVWSLAGGAICRIAALHAARDEKISLTEAVKFSLDKFVSFLTAPLIPVILLVVIGAVTFAGGLVGGIPWVGELLAGVLWFLALVAGLIMALVAIGAVGGVHLMYPTVATEGSDAFDAISRSYSYIYSKPWRTAWYLLVAIVYGTICFLFVKFMAFLLLRLAHLAAALGMNIDGAGRLATYGKLEAIWSAPTWSGPFFGGFFGVPLTTTEGIAAILMSIVVFIVVGLVVAFVVSFFFSASTVMYLLLRREVDATDFADVYIEEEQEQADEDVPPVEAEAEQQPAEAPEAVEPTEEQAPEQQGEGTEGGETEDKS